ncbi:hypothetical protein [Pelosinus sp. UFO1]|uniref:hypothetical protein n=1 Tax=Pelosinus sp. UFO1 TaxID=484770 RepID=UPI0004D15D8B|nr:hypothetical protein [Pelosinus sp. UFO1]AIF51232.1 hypothetical protein UFO1_1681 [Pelosinus sp. UFO1]
MLPITSYINQLINQLDFHYLRIEKEATLIQESSFYFKQEEGKHFIEAVIFFVHYILTTSELRAEFDLLLGITEQKRAEYLNNNIVKIKEALQIIGNFFLENSEYMNKIRELDTNSWRLPSPHEKDYFNFMQIEQFLHLCKDCSNIKRFDYRILSRIKGNLLGNGQGIPGIIKEGICPEADWNTPPFGEAVSLVTKSVNELEKIELFEHSFGGSKSVEYLATIYDWYINKEFTGFKIDLQECIRNCDILYNYLKHKMSTHLSKQAVIKRFITYMELYSREDSILENDKYSEKFFQKEFERFSFLHGLYPISEAQLNGARIDTLLTTPDQSFLCELKQIGFGSESLGKMNQSKLIEKLKHAVTQSHLYKDRLAGYPALLTDIYIIGISRVPFKLDKDYVEYNNTTYHFHIIDLSGLAPSKLQPITISIRDVFA